MSQNNNLDERYESKYNGKRVAFNSKFESVDTNLLRFKQKNNFHTRSDLAKYLSVNNPFLVPYSSSVLKNNLTNWNKNYLLHEKFENWLITSGSEIYQNIYVGNIIDYNNVISNNKLKEKKQALMKQLGSFDTKQNPELTYKIRGTLLALDQKIDNNNAQNANNDYKVLINCKEGVEFPKVELIDSVFQKSEKLLSKETDLIYLEFPSSGSYALSSITNSHMLSIINFLKLLHYLSITKGHKILIYCYDGFTHLSLLSLMLEISYTFNNLNNAILKYYLVYEKYLYWFKIDYEIMNFLQGFLLFYSPRNPDQEGLKLGGLQNTHRTIGSIDYKQVKHWYEAGYLAQYNLNPFEFLKIYQTNPKLKALKNNSVINDELYPIEDEKHGLPLKAKEDTWFSPENDNNLPSRILPYLYLGGINHLSSKTILELLEINYIITIGEKPTWLNLVEFDNKFNYEGLDPVLKAKFNKNDIIEIDNPLPFVKKLIYLPNVQDNGIDSFEPYFLYLLRVIRRLREENQKLDEEEQQQQHNDEQLKKTGRNKVLVNCKVGVSRSASLCIAEVMNFLKISLPRAYLYVRVRRLNLIIQPNLKIFYNLAELEEILTIKENIKIKYINSKIEDYNKKHKLRENNIEGGIAEDGGSRKKKALPLRKMRVLREVDWHILCKEIDILNSHYIKA